MSEFDMNGNVVAETVTKSAPSAIETLVQRFKPGTVTTAVETPAKRWTIGSIEAMAGKRNNFVCVRVENPKKPGSIAHRNWSLYGKVGQPSVTVAQFLRGGDVPYYPAKDGGVTRARQSLLWDLDRGFVTIVEVA